MKETDDDRVPNFAAPGEHGLRAFIDWLNEKLYPLIGPADLGPYDQIVSRVGEASCAECSRPMAEHFVDHSASDPLLHCPSSDAKA